MRTSLVSLISLSSILAVAGCGPLPDDAGGPDTELRASALTRDSDGNVVYPDTETGGSSSSCTAGGSPANLLVADTFDYAKHGGHTLTSSAFTLYLCTTHFPVGSAARAEVQKAVDLYNKVTGTAVSITLGTMAHKTIAELFPNRPTNNYMDVVDNSMVGFPCHAAGDTTIWAMNTCRYGASYGPWQSNSTSIDHFVISVNANEDAYSTFLSLPTASSGFPRFENVAHEIGHGLGMEHMPYWTDTGTFGLLSTMQGGLSILPSHDRGYVRHFYPGAPGSTLNLVASPEVRVPDASTSLGFTNVDFADANPSHLYLVSGLYRDCATGAPPVFQAQWLNHGQAASSCTVKNRFRIGPAGDEASSAKVTIKAWDGARMPTESQDRIASTVTIDEAKLAGFAKETTYDLTFKVDWQDTDHEANEDDNVITTPITLHDSYLECFTLVPATRAF